MAFEHSYPGAGGLALSIAPIFTSPCDLATRLPGLIAEFLDLEEHLKRRFREDSVTDILVASLLSLPGDNVVVLTPPEAKTGGDFDLVLVEPMSGKAVQFRIQAKRLTPHKTNWMTSSYVELAHPHNNGGQSAKLIKALARETIPTIPLYMFYNPASICAASDGAIDGIALASGWEIRERVRTMVQVKPKRLPYKRIGSLEPLFFPLTTLLCPPPARSSASLFPHPEEVRAEVERAIEDRTGLAGIDQTTRIEGQTVRRLPGKTDRSVTMADRRRAVRHRDGNDLPVAIQAAIARRGERITRMRGPRPRIILIADGTDTPME